MTTCAMKYALILAALALAGCNIDGGMSGSGTGGGPEPRPPEAHWQWPKDGDIVDVKAGVPACYDTNNPPYAEDILGRYYNQHFTPDEHEAAERFLKPRCFFTKQMMRGVIIYHYSVPHDFYCIRGHNKADCIWVADNSFVEVKR